jgi:hypothetical protein
MKRMLTTKEAARRLHVSTETLRRWDRQGLIEAGIYEATAGGHRRWHEDRIEDLRPLIGQGAATATAKSRRDLETQVKELRDDLDRERSVTELLMVAVGLIALLLVMIAVYGSLMPAMVDALRRSYGMESGPWWTLIGPGAMTLLAAASFALSAMSAVAAALAVRAMVARDRSRAESRLRLVGWMLPSSWLVAFVCVIATSMLPPLTPFLDAKPHWFAGLGDLHVSGTLGQIIVWAPPVVVQSLIIIASSIASLDILRMMRRLVGPDRPKTLIERAARHVAGT